MMEAMLKPMMKADWRRPRYRSGVPVRTLAEMKPRNSCSAAHEGSESDVSPTTSYPDTSSSVYYLVCSRDDAAINVVDLHAGHQITDITTTDLILQGSRCWQPTMLMANSRMIAASTVHPPPSR